MLFVSLANCFLKKVSSILDNKGQARMKTAIAWNSSQTFMEYFEHLRTPRRPQADDLKPTANLFKSMPTQYIIHSLEEAGGLRCSISTKEWSVFILVQDVVLPRNLQN